MQPWNRFFLVRAAYKFSFQISQLEDGIGLDNATYVASVAASLDGVTGASGNLSVGNLNASVNAIDIISGLRVNVSADSVDDEEIQVFMALYNISILNYILYDYFVK